MVNKTIADAYEALDGDLKNSFLFRRSDKFLTYHAKKGGYICLDYVNDREYEEYGHQYVCTVEEFNNYKMESKMIKFDLEKALAGDKVVTRDGRAVYQISSFDNVSGEKNIVGVRGRILIVWSEDELFMAPKKLSGFVNVYDDGRTGFTNDTRKECDETCREGRIAVIALSQFEEGHGL